MRTHVCLLQTGWRKYVFYFLKIIYSRTSKYIDFHNYDILDGSYKKGKCIPIFEDNQHYYKTPHKYRLIGTGLFKTGTYEPFLTSLR